MIMLLLVVVAAVTVGAGWRQTVAAVVIVAVSFGVAFPLWRWWLRRGGPDMSGTLVFGDHGQLVVHGRFLGIALDDEGFVGTVRGVRRKPAVRIEGRIGGARVQTVLLEGQSRRVGGIPMRYDTARSVMLHKLRPGT